MDFFDPPFCFYLQVHYFTTMSRRSLYSFFSRSASTAFGRGPRGRMGRDYFPGPRYPARLTSLSFEH